MSSSLTLLSGGGSSSHHSKLHMLGSSSPSARNSVHAFDEMDVISAMGSNNNDLDEELAAMAATLADDHLSSSGDGVGIGIDDDNAAAVAAVFPSSGVPPVLSTTEISSLSPSQSGKVHPLTFQTQVGVAVEPPPAKRIKLEGDTNSNNNNNNISPTIDDNMKGGQRVSTHTLVQLSSAATPVTANNIGGTPEGGQLLPPLGVLQPADPSHHSTPSQPQQQQQQQLNHPYLHQRSDAHPTTSSSVPLNDSHPPPGGEGATATTSVSSSSKVHPYGGSSVVTAVTTDGSHQETCQSSGSSHDSLTDATTGARQSNATIGGTNSSGSGCSTSYAITAPSTLPSAPPALTTHNVDGTTTSAQTATMMTSTTSVPQPPQEESRPNHESVDSHRPSVPTGPTTTTTMLGNGSLTPSSSSAAAAVVTVGTEAGTGASSGSLNNQIMTVSNPIASPVPEAPTATAAAAAAVVVPLKSVNFGHLRIKYLEELEYMLREFRKLERQLLGAKGAAQLEESAGSRERREKLHSFILHLEDTIRQIEMGCKVECEGKQQRTIDETSQEATLSASSATPGGGEGTVPDLSPAKRQMAEESALANLTKEKEDEENVQKLEEHILANLLPVKVRLKKQLAAQQGATQNPAGMPALRRGSLQPPSAARGKGTFAEAAEKRRKQAEAARLAAQEQHERAVRRVSDPSQFGKPLSGGGSSLTQKLHGATLGSTERVHGHGVGTRLATQEGSAKDGKPIGADRKILYAGMVPGSNQIESGLSAASGVHEIVGVTTIQAGSSASNEHATLKVADPDPSPVTASALPAAAAPARPKIVNKVAVNVQPKPIPTVKAPTPTIVTAEQKSSVPSAGQVSTTLAAIEKKDTGIESVVTEDERRMMKKQRRKRKLLRLARRQERERLKQQAPVPQQPPTVQLPQKPAVGRKKAASGKSQKKKGPRSVEYICALCSEAYASTCDYNPWWALAQHDCPKCRKNQIPRIDITSPANAIEYHPALLAHVDDNASGGGDNGNNGAPSSPTPCQAIAPSPTPVASQLQSSDDAETAANAAIQALDSESDTDLSELSDDDISIGSLNSEDSEGDFQAMTPAEQAEHETFGSEYAGPCLQEGQAARLLLLMSHASTCPCHHRSTKHRDVCMSTKYLMLHVRDCPGTTSTLDVCPFPWCRKVKHLLYHLVSCDDPDTCAICSPKDLPKGMQGLIGLNAHRMKKFRESMIAASKAAATASAMAIPKHPTVVPAIEQSENSKKPLPVPRTPVVQAPIASAPSKSECPPVTVASNAHSATASLSVDIHGSLMTTKLETVPLIASSSDQVQVRSNDPAAVVMTDLVPEGQALQSIESPPVFVSVDPSQAPPSESTNPIDPLTPSAPVAALESFPTVPMAHISVAEGNVMVEQPGGIVQTLGSVSDAVAATTEALGAVSDPNSTHANGTNAEQAASSSFSAPPTLTTAVTVPQGIVGSSSPSVEATQALNSTVVVAAPGIAYETGQHSFGADGANAGGVAVSRPVRDEQQQVAHTLQVTTTTTTNDISDGTNPSLVDHGVGSTMLDESLVKVQGFETDPELLNVQLQEEVPDIAGLSDSRTMVQPVLGVKTEDTYVGVKTEDTYVGVKTEDTTFVAGVPDDGPLDVDPASCVYEDPSAAPIDATVHDAGTVVGSDPATTMTTTSVPVSSSNTVNQVVSPTTAVSEATPLAATAAVTDTVVPGVVNNNHNNSIAAGSDGGGTVPTLASTKVHEIRTSSATATTTTTTTTTATAVGNRTTTDVETTTTTTTIAGPVKVN